MCIHDDKQKALANMKITPNVVAHVEVQLV